MKPRYIPECVVIDFKNGVVYDAAYLPSGVYRSIPIVTPRSVGHVTNVTEENEGEVRLVIERENR